MKCGNCHGCHADVVAVRACYAARIAAAVQHEVQPSATAPNWDRQVLPARTEPSAVLSMEKITEKQEAWLNKLLSEHPAFRDVENLWPSVIAKLSKPMASALIAKVSQMPAERLEACASPSSLEKVLEAVPDGYYALACMTGGNDLDFIRVASNQGRVNPANKGRRKVQRILGGHEPILMRYAEQLEFAQRIAKMTDAARLEAQRSFGQNIGRCGKCGITLTDETSRAYGIGPTCRKG